MSRCGRTHQDRRIEEFMVFAINKIVLISMYAVLFRHKKCTLALTIRIGTQETCERRQRRERKKCDCIHVRGIRFIGQSLDCMRIEIRLAPIHVWRWPMGY